MLNVRLSRTSAWPIDRRGPRCIIVSQDVSRRFPVPVTINGKKVYRIGEALEQAGLSRATYFRWVQQGRIPDTQYKDRNQRRVFTEEELEQLTRAANQLVESNPQLRMPLEGA